MTDMSNKEQAVEILQDLGLKEYEARSFVALSRRQQGTAKNISESSSVPRTRVYDAVRVLEAQGLVETQQSNPKQFRAVSPDEAVDILRQQYKEKIEAFAEALSGIDPVTDDTSQSLNYDVWTLSSGTAIASRTQQLIKGAESELILVVGHPSVFTDGLADRLQQATTEGTQVVIGTVSEELAEEIATSVSDVEVFVSGLDWLAHPPTEDDDTEISRLLLVDGEAFLVSTFLPDAAGGRNDEKAVFGRGFDNGFVAIARRIFSTGLLQQFSPETTASEQD